MIDLANDFTTLKSEYQKVIQLAQETNHIRITPLLELKGGQTGANLYLVSVSSVDSKKVYHLVLKLDHKSTKTQMDELERHSIAVKQASAEFSHNHIPELEFERIEEGGAVAIFYKIAGQSLHQYKSLSSFQQLDKIEMIFKATNDILLVKWNAHPEFEQAVHPQKVLTSWLGYRLKSGGNIENFLSENCQIHHETPGLLIQGNVFPNPWAYARSEELWGDARAIDTLKGFQHGDLNIGNIIVKFNENNDSLEGYYLIDFALFKPDMPLFYDILYLQMSYLIRELDRVTFPGWIEFVTRFSESDTVDANKVPVELTGAGKVINAARTEFKDWVNKCHSSLSDDLWGQYWLAAVAVGLNYCNKTIISDTGRLAGLIFAAAHLKQYHKMFDVALPEDIRNIRIDSRRNRTFQNETYSEQRSTRENIKLPAQATPLIGRESEIKEISDIFRREDLRLLTLTGPGGTGKTRLAVHMASQLSDLFIDGVFFVDLSPVREPESLLSTIARTVGVRETSDQPLIDGITRQLREKDLLLLLDNFEQLTSAIPLVADLLGTCPRLKLLVTSREALRIRGEQVFPVSPLALPDVGQKELSLDQVIQFESIQLFMERASAVRPDFKITAENVSVVAGICSRLDGLPLAIELAVARIKLFSPEELLKKLDSRMKLLRGGARDLPVRQQTLEHTIDWSYELLDNPEKRLFALFSVFHDCSFEEIESFAPGFEHLDEGQADIVDVLTSLIDKNLIRTSEQAFGKMRLQMLETIREYASERLAEDPDFSASVRRKHATFYVDYSQQQWKHLTGNEREAALKDFEVNVENVRIAWRYWVSEKDPGQLQKVTDCLWLLYDARGWYSAIVELTTDLLNVIGSAPSTPESYRQEIVLQTSLGRVLMAIKGCTPEVESIYKGALELCEKYGEIPKSFPILRALASFYAYVGLMDKCISFGEQILGLAEQLDDEYMKVEGHLILGFSTAFSGDLHKGLDYLEKGIAIYQPDLSKSKSFRFGNNPGLICYTTSAICSWMLGFPERSNSFTEKALALAEKLDHPSSKIYVLFHSGLLHHFKGEHESALKYAKMALQISDNQEFHIWKAVVTCLHGAALASVGQIEEGMAEFTHGLEKYSELKTPPIFWPMLLFIKAGVYMHANKLKESLHILDEASAILGQDTGNPILSELNRLKGEILIMVSPDKLNQAEALFINALEIAVKHRTVTFELRAAVSLSRLWIRENKIRQSREIMSKAIDKFTEGFETAEFKEAKALFEQLK